MHVSLRMRFIQPYPWHAGFSTNFCGGICLGAKTKWWRQKVNDHQDPGTMQKLPFLEFACAASPICVDGLSPHLKVNWLGFWLLCMGWVITTWSRGPHNQWVN